MQEPRARDPRLADNTALRRWEAVASNVPHNTTQTTSPLGPSSASASEPGVSLSEARKPWRDLVKTAAPSPDCMSFTDADVSEVC